MGDTEVRGRVDSTSNTVDGGKRERILRAAVKVFAQKGYFGSRVSDIAEEAGIAYGLVYHYFKNKEELLLALFQESWDLLLRRIREVRASPLGAREKLRQIAAFLLKGFRADPERMEVLVVEVIRSSKILKGQTLEMIREAFHLLEEIVEEGKREGVVRKDLDSRLATSILYGALDQIITDWVLGLYPRRRDEEELALEMVDRIILGGMTPPART
jgi:AcrR family transcriptional regulator